MDQLDMLVHNIKLQQALLDLWMREDRVYRYYHFLDWQQFYLQHLRKGSQVPNRHADNFESH
jgi:hypothetical protein